jgi:hypothetical protein
MKNLEQKEGFLNRHTNPLPNHSEVIEVITKGYDGQFNFICNWKPYIKNEEPEWMVVKEGYLGTATPISMEDKAKLAWLHAWEQGDESFVYYRFL